MPRHEVAAMVGRFLFGDDIFVSYSRQDAVKYAEGLAGELSEKRIPAVSISGSPSREKRCRHRS
jgi:hypothetical protein